MRRLHRIVLIIAAFILFPVYHGETKALESSAVFLSETTHSFGTVMQGETINHAFVIRNAGSAPLKIARMELSELGMTARVTPLIPPGQEGKVTVKWDTLRVKGELTGEVVVYLDDPAQPPIVLLLKGVVKPPLEIVPSRAVFLSLFKGESAESTVTIVNNETRPLTITRLEARGQHFVANFHTVESGKIYQIVVKVLPDTPPGRYLEGLDVYTDNPQRAQIKMAVNVLVKENLYTFPDVVDFGTVSLAQLAKTPSILKVLTQTLLVKKREGEFEITGVTTTVPFLRIHLEPAGKSGTFRIDVSLVQGEVRPGKLDGSLRIKTTEGDFPELVIPVQGEFR